MRRLSIAALLTGVLALGACSGGGTVAPTVPEAASVEPAPTASATPASHPKATKQPAATKGPSVSLAVRLTGPGAVTAGSDAAVTATTAPSASCTIEVDYASGPSKAQGLGAQVASSSGAVTWTWKVGSRTTKGGWPVTVRCTKGSASATARATLTVE